MHRIFLIFGVQIAPREKVCRESDELLLLIECVCNDLIRYLDLFPISESMLEPLDLGIVNYELIDPWEIWLRF